MAKIVIENVTIDSPMRWCARCYPDKAPDTLDLRDPATPSKVCAFVVKADDAGSLDLCTKHMVGVLREVFNLE